MYVRIYVIVGFEFLPIDIGDTRFVHESFSLGEVNLIFDDNPDPIQLFPLFEDDNVGLEDPETSTLVLRIGPITDPDKVIIDPARVDIIVLDNDGMTSPVCVHCMNGMSHVHMYMCVGCHECSEFLFACLDTCLFLNCKAIKVSSIVKPLKSLVQIFPFCKR